MATSSDITVWLYGTPIFSLSYSLGHKKINDTSHTTGRLTDISGYRPDPRSILESGKTYQATGVFAKETHEGNDITILRYIQIGDKKIAYIR